MLSALLDVSQESSEVVVLDEVVGVIGTEPGNAVPFLLHLQALLARYGLVGIPNA